VRTDHLVHNQLLLAQALDSLADHIANSTGYALTPVTFANLPASPTRGMLAVITNSTVNTWGSTVAGGGANVVLCWYNGTNWTVIGV
jgi:hypothetical protein